MPSEEIARPSDRMFDPTSLNAEVDKTQQKADRQRKLSFIAENLGNFLTAGARARTGAGDMSAMYDKMRADYQQKPDLKRQERREAIRDYYRQKQLQDRADQRASNEDWRRKQFESDQEWRRRTYEQGEKDREYQKERDNKRFDLQNKRIEARAQERELQQQDRASKEQEQEDEKRLQLEVGDVGIAKTKTDAKDLKTAVELKDKLDRQIGEMIDLRKKYGTEYLNDNAVERGKQLSKDLLLTYKNLAKLGVLSKSDEDIINQIIPADPLGHDWNPFYDSILHRLEGFRGDINSDFDTRVRNRLRNPDEYFESESKNQTQQREKYDWED